MPERRRLAARSREGADNTPPNQVLDLTTLTDQEEKIIQAVIQKDELEKRILDSKISEIRKEIQEIRKASTLTDGDDQNTICARCKFKFMPFPLPWVDNGQRCVTCKFRVCVNCRTKQPNGSWLCILCFKCRQEKLLTGEWITKGQSSNLFGSELLRASLRDRSQARSGYEEASGDNYIQRPAKLKNERSDSESSVNSPPIKPQREQELRREKASSQRSATDVSTTSVQSSKSKDSPQQPPHQIRQGDQSSPFARDGDNRSMGKSPEGNITGHPKLQHISSTPFADKVNSEDIMPSLSIDIHLENYSNITDDKDNSGTFNSSDNNHSTNTNHDSSNLDQVDHPNITHCLSPHHKDPRGKRAHLKRNISVSEQTLYYDDVKLVHPNIPRFSSLDSRSISSLCSDYSINPKYRTMKQSSGTSELELFRKRGERYSLRRKKVQENESSVEKEDSMQESIEVNDTMDSSESQVPTEVKPAPIPHWHEILRVQSVVDSFTKQNKSPTTAPSPIKNSDSSVDYQIFPLMNPKIKTPRRKDSKCLSPNNSKDDSSSSQESISVYVASYMTPTQNLDLENIFSSTPNVSNGSKPTSKSLKRQNLSSRTQISAATQNSSQELSGLQLNTPQSQRKNMSPTGHKLSRSYFNITKSKLWTKLKGWKGKRKLPLVEKIEETPPEKGSDKVNWPIIQRQNSYSHAALENEKVATSSPKGSINRTSCWWKEGTSDSVHASDEAETLELRRGHDSDTSSLSSCTTDSQQGTSSANTGHSSEDSGSLCNDRSSRDSYAPIAVTRPTAVLPSKFRFRRLSSSLNEVKSSGSQHCSSPQSQVKSMTDIDTSTGIAQSCCEPPAGNHINLVDVKTSDEYNDTKLPPNDKDKLNNTSPKEEDVTKKTLAKSQDSFEDVFNSNASLYMQMMSNDNKESPESNTTSIQVLPDCPLDGKSPRLLLQQSLSLSEELAENAAYHSLEDDESENDETAVKDLRITHSIEEPRLLLPSEIKKQPDLWQNIASNSPSRHHMQLHNSQLPIRNTALVSGEGKAINKMAPGKSNEKSFIKDTEIIRNHISQNNSLHFQEKHEIVVSKKPNQLEGENVPVVEITLQEPEGPLVVDLSRSGSNLSDIVGSNVSGNVSVVSEMSDLRGEAESYDYNSDQGSDDTFHNSNIDNSFSDDDQDDGIAPGLTGDTQADEELKPIRTASFSNDRAECKHKYINSRNNDGFGKGCYDLEHSVELSSSSLDIQTGGVLTSRSSNVLEDSNPEGYYTEREPSIDSQISDLDDEGLVCSTESRESTESHQDMKRATCARRTVDIQRSSREGSYRNNENFDMDGDVDKGGKLGDNRELVEAHGCFNNKSATASAVDGSDMNQKFTEYPLGKQSKKTWDECRSFSCHDSYLPPADVDLDDNCDNAACHKAHDRDNEEYEPVRDPGPSGTDGSNGGVSSNDRFRLQAASHANHLGAPAIAVSNMAEQNVKRRREYDEDEDEEADDLDDLFSQHHPNQLLGSRNSLADSRESIYSIYSDAGEVNYGRIRVTGEIMFDMNYNYKTNTFEVRIIQCKDLAPVDTKHNKSDPYVKVYLLPDKSRSSKRKTKIKKHTLGPVFDEVLKYQINKAELETRSLWVTVWHSDRFGRNDFLGEVTINLDYYGFDESAPKWYPLQERAAVQDSMMGYKGDLFLSLKYITPDMIESGPKKKPGSSRKKGKEKDKPDLGEIHVLIKEAQNLTAMRGSAGSDPFCKGYLLPDESHTSKQKTPVIKRTCNPQWHSMLVFEGVDQSLLHQHGLELTVWDYERLSSNDFLGGVRLSLGKGTDQDKSFEWMDSRGEEVEAWQGMIDHPNSWVDIQLPLRVSMDKLSVKK